ncbi:MAG: class I SAM-dependent methyltransferase [Planctomycetaceae bacterium]
MLTDVEVLSLLTNSPELWTAVREEAGTELQRQQRLRKQFDPALVRGAIELEELRRLAPAKFSRGDRMWFDRKGLEQATPEAVSQHKAIRFRSASLTEPVYDLCSGIGGDAIALSAAAHVIGCDLSEVNSRRLELNAAVYDVADRITAQTVDITTLNVRDRVIHLDPDRRAQGGRSLRLEGYQPDLSFMQQITREASGGAIKVSPASNFGGKFSGCEIELVSLNGECKEATIWFGSMAPGELWRATVLPSGATLSGQPLDAETIVQPLGTYLYDPDPAVVRAGLVDLLAAEIGLWRVDDAEEYLSSDKLVDSPFVRAFEVLEVVSNNPREIREAVRRAECRSIEIKCRHVPTDADALRRKLPLDGDREGVLFIARLQGKTHALTARRV